MGNPLPRRNGIDRREFVATAEGRLDAVLAAACPDLSRARLQRLIAEGHVTVNGAPAQKSLRVTEGDRLAVEIPETEHAAPATGVALNILYEDEHIVAVDKPPGLAVHGAPGDAGPSVAAWFVERYPAEARAFDAERPGIVHRLDKGTSGLLMVARSPLAYDALVAQLSARTVDRSYTTLVCRHFDEREGVVDAPIGRSARAPTRMAVTPRGRDARTRYEVVARFIAPFAASLLSCRLESGRTHQIRVHLSAIGAPVLGDDRYGGRRVQVPIGRPFLHAARLGFVHPVTGEALSFESPLPTDLVEVLARFS